MKADKTDALRDIEEAIDEAGWSEPFTRISLMALQWVIEDPAGVDAWLKENTESVETQFGVIRYFRHPLFERSSTSPLPPHNPAT